MVISFEKNDLVAIRLGDLDYLARFGFPREKLRGRVGVVFRSELFDVETGPPWAYNAPSFGIPFAAKNVIVLIECDDAYPIFPEQYRQFLSYKGGSASRVSA